MSIDFLYPEYEVVRNERKCTVCRLCVSQCSNGVHRCENGVMLSDDARCVACHRCVSFCPTGALKIVKSGHVFRENANWKPETITDVYRQAGSGGVLLSSMGAPGGIPVYWDRILIGASQVTNPSIDPLREPMETRTFLGAKPAGIERDSDGRLVDNLPPQLDLDLPILFSAMSYGSISYNAHASLARAAEALGIYYNTGEGGLHEDFYRYGKNTIVQVASGRFGVHKSYLDAAAPLRSRSDRVRSPESAVICPAPRLRRTFRARV